MNKTSIKLLCRNAGLTLVGSLTLAAVATVSQTEKASAIDLSFSTVDRRTAFSPTDTGIKIYYQNVATGIDAVVTRSVFTVPGTPQTSPDTGTYSFVNHIPNYTAAGSTNGDAGFLYQIDSGYGKGGMDYTFDFFTGGTTTASHTYTTKIAPADFRFLVYDVDGQTLGDTFGTGTVGRTQTEAVRIADNSGLIGYQVGTTAQALIPTRGADGSYLFSGRNKNVAETDASGSTVLYFSGVNTVNFRFETDTIKQTGSTSAADGVFSAIDGDLSIIKKTGTAFNDRVLPGFGAFVPATSVPEPFTIIGTLIGGTAAFRMRKKLKAGSKA